MGKLTGRRADGTSLKTKSLSPAKESPVHVDLSAIGDVAAVVDVR